MVVLVPLLILPGVLFHFDVTPKAVTLLAGVSLAMVLGLRPAAPKLLGRLLALQAVSLVVSTLVSTDPALSVAGANWRRFGLATQLALVIFSMLLPAPGLWRAVAASGGLAALYGIAQYFGADPFLPRQGYLIGEGVWTIVRPPGTLGHAGYFGVYLLHVVFAGIGVGKSDLDRVWRWTGGASATLAAAAILLSGTRAAVLGLAAGALTLALRHRTRLTTRRLAAAGLLMAGMGVFYFSSGGQLLRSRVKWSLEDRFGGGRPTLWADTLRMAVPRLMAGYGPETFSSQFPSFQSEKLARQFPDRYYESPHNIFLDALVSQGVAGLAALAGLAAFGLWSLRRNDVLLAGLVAALVANQFVSFIVPTALLFYLTIAAGAAPEGEPRTLGRWAVLPAGAAPEPRTLPRWVALPAALALLAVACSFAWTDFWMARTRAALDGGRIEQAIGRYRTLRRFALPGVDTDLWYSRALFAAANRGAWQEAFEAAERSARTSEQRFNACYNLAAFYALENDFAGTERSLRAAIAIAPRWYKPRWMLAQVFQQAGRVTEAAVEARRAAELNPSLPQPAGSVP